MAAPLILLIIALIPLVFVRRFLASPTGVVCLVVLFMFVLKYFYNYYNQVPFLDRLTTEQITSEIPVLSVYLLTSFCFAAAFSALFQKKRRKSVPAQPGEREIHLVPFLFPLNVIVVAASMVLALGLGINPFLNPLGFRQLMQSQGLYYLLSMILFIAYAQALYVPYLKFALKKPVPWTLLASLLVSLSFCATSGLAHTFLFAIVIPLMFFYACYGNRAIYITAAFLPIFVGYTLIYSYYRDVNRTSEIAMSAATSRVLADPHIVVNVMNRFDYLESFTLASSYTLNKEPDFGAHLSGALVQFVPRKLWPGKPEGISTTLTKILLPSMYYAAGATSNFISVQEFTNAFGRPGVILGGLLFGVILAVAHRQYALARGDEYYCARYLLVIFPYVLTGFLAGFVFDLALPVLILNSLYFSAFVRSTPAKARKPHARRSFAQNLTAKFPALVGVAREMAR